MRKLNDLEAWKKCRDFRNKVRNIYLLFPPNEKYHLVDQLKRSSRSTTANIAEGFGRFHYQENIQFCRQSRGSLNEVLDHLICAYDEEYITKEELSELKADYELCLKILNGYIAFLQKQKQKDIDNNKKSNKNPNNDTE